jgi:hypothetical protein
MKTGISVWRAGCSGVVIAIAAVLLHCASGQLQQKPVVIAVSEPDSLIPADRGMFDKEIARFTMMLQQNDTSVKREELLTRLFGLYVHVNNPRPQYANAIILADSLVKETAGRQDRQYYCNWRNILQKYLKLNAIRDSLERVVGKISEDNKSLRYMARKQTRQIDSLSGMINTQKSALQKLQELDMKLEQQRSKIQ